MITIPFQCLKYEGTAPGLENTTIQIWDSEVTGGGGLMRSDQPTEDSRRRKQEPPAVEGERRTKETA